MTQLANDATEKAQEIRRKLGIPVLTREDIESRISSVQYHQFPGTTATVCCLTLKNGGFVIGESGCIDPDRFNQELGEKYSLENAIDKIWKLEAYFALEMRSMKHQSQ